MIPRKSKTMSISKRFHIYEAVRGGWEHRAIIRGSDARDAKDSWLSRYPDLDPSDVRARLTLMPQDMGGGKSRKVANPSASCPRQSPKFNAYQGRTVKYRKKSYEIEGCGIGRTAKRSIGKQEEGTYALRALKTGKKKYVAKRVIRDLAYHRGGKAILGMPKRKKAVKNPSRKMSAAEKAAFVKRMARARAAKGR